MHMSERQPRVHLGGIGAWSGSPVAFDGRQTGTGGERQPGDAADGLELVGEAHDGSQSMHGHMGRTRRNKAQHSDIKATALRPTERDQSDRGELSVGDGVTGRRGRLRTGWPGLSGMPPSRLDD